MPSLKRCCSSALARCFTPRSRATWMKWADWANECGITFLAQPRSEHAKQAHEASTTMLLGQGLLTAVCVFLGLCPTIFLAVFDPVTKQLTGPAVSSVLTASNGFVLSGVLAEGGTVSTIGITLAALVLVVVPFL